MTRKEFIKGYAERSGCSPEFLMGWLVALPCECGDDLCDGWAMVPDDPERIRMHIKRYISSGAVALDCVAVNGFGNAATIGAALDES